MTEYETSEMSDDERRLQAYDTLVFYGELMRMSGGSPGSNGFYDFVERIQKVAKPFGESAAISSDSSAPVILLEIMRLAQMIGGDQADKRDAREEAQRTATSTHIEGHLSPEIKRTIRAITE